MLVEGMRMASGGLRMWSQKKTLWHSPGASDEVRDKTLAWLSYRGNPSPASATLSTSLDTSLSSELLLFKFRKPMSLRWSPHSVHSNDAQGLIAKWPCFAATIFKGSLRVWIARYGNMALTIGDYWYLLQIAQYLGITCLC